MGKRAPSAPAAPDYEAIIRAQQQANTQAAMQNAVLNRTNQSGPLGSIQWQQNGTDPATGMPIWSSTVTNSPQNQALLEQYQRMQGLRGQFAEQLLRQHGGQMMNPLAGMQGAPGIYMPNPNGGQGTWMGGANPFGGGSPMTGGAGAPGAGGMGQMGGMMPMPGGGGMGGVGAGMGGTGQASQPPSYNPALLGQALRG